MTVSDLIKATLRLIGVLASGETPSAAESADALSALNRMFKSWNIEGLLVFKVTREEFSLVAGQASRTMGTGGNFSTTRPNRILNAAVEDGTTEIPIDILTADQWAEITDKSTQARNPTKIYPEGTYPLETLNFWPIPTAANTLVLHSLKPIATTLALSDTISLPDGYDEAIIYNFALRLAPEYGKTLDALIVETAVDLKAGLMRQNTKPVYAQSDAFGLTQQKTFNIETGE